MKTFFFALLLSGIAFCGYSQEWETVFIDPIQTQFNLPVTPIITDSLHTAFYNGSVDSLLGIQVYLFDSAYFDGTDPYLAQALNDNNGDTLRVIAQLALFATHAELTALNDILINGHGGLEIGLDYPELQSNIPTLTFMRYFMLGNRFLCFTITGSKDDLPRFMSYKDQFFNGINIH